MGDRQTKLSALGEDGDLTLTPGREGRVGDLCPWGFLCPFPGSQRENDSNLIHYFHHQLPAHFLAPSRGAVNDFDE